MMTPEQFEDCLDCYGTNFANWPEDKAEAARPLLEMSESARQAFDDALLLNDALDGYEIAPPGASLEARLLDLASKPAEQYATKKRSGLPGWFSLRTATMAGLSLACAAFGFVVSLQSYNSYQTEAEAEAFLVASGSYLSEDIWSGETQ